MAKVEKACEKCSQSFQVPEYKVRQGKGKYCGKPCYDAAQSPSLAEKFWPNVTKGDECWLYSNLNSSGYGQMGHRGKMLGAHRVSWELHYGPIPPMTWVLHRCDNPPCVRPDHLFLGTPKDNTQDMKSKGRQRPPGYPAHRRVLRGEEIAQARLSAVDIPTIRARFEQGSSMRSIARAYGVTHEAIRKIVRGETWTHV